MLDYPHRSACILWFAGCNMRCLYCYNPDIVFGKGTLDFVDVIAFLKTRVGLLDAVVFSGGECLLHKDIIALATAIKRMGFLIKIDTNGSRPEVLRQLAELSLIDYVALDFKALPIHFRRITQSNLFEAFEKSLLLLYTASIAFEVRTTVHSDLIDNATIGDMVRWLEQTGYRGNYYLQHFQNGRDTIKKLPHSYRICDSFDTPNIKIVLRG